MSAPDLNTLLNDLWNYNLSMQTISQEISDKAKAPADISNDIQALLNQMNALESTMNAYQLDNPTNPTATLAFQCFEQSIDGLVSADALIKTQGFSEATSALSDITISGINNQHSFQQIFSQEVTNVQIAWGQFNSNPNLANAQALNSLATGLNTYLSNLLAQPNNTMTSIAGALSISVTDLEKLGSYPAGTGGLPSLVNALSTTILPNLQAGKDAFAGAPDLQAQLQSLWTGSTGVNSITWPSAASWAPQPAPPPNKQ